MHWLMCWALLVGLVQCQSPYEMDDDVVLDGTEDLEGSRNGRGFGLNFFAARRAAQFAAQQQAVQQATQQVSPFAAQQGSPFAAQQGSPFAAQQGSPFATQQGSPFAAQQSALHSRPQAFASSNTRPVYSDGTSLYNPFKPKVPNFQRNPFYTATAPQPQPLPPPPVSQSRPYQASPPAAPAPVALRPQEQRLPPSYASFVSPPQPPKQETLVSQSSSYTPAALESGFIPIVNGQRLAQPPHASSQVIHEIKPPSYNQPAALGSPALPQYLQAVASSSKSSFSKPQPPAPLLTVPREKLVNHRQVIPELNIAESKKRAQEAYFIPHGVNTSVSTRVVVGSGGDRFDSLRTSSSLVYESKALARKKTSPLLDCDGSKDLGWCELGAKYPRSLTEQVLVQCKDLVSVMYVEIPHSFEKLSDTSDFRTALDRNSSQEARERGSHESWSWAAYSHQGELCEAERGFLRPEAARDSTGKWNLVVQTDEVRQRVPIEMCRKTNSSCKKMLTCGLKSQCLQKYNYHALLSLDPDDLQGCPTMKLYRLPSACVCHVQ